MCENKTVHDGYIFVYISVPMRDRSQEDIDKDIHDCFDACEKRFGADNVMQSRSYYEPYLSNRKIESLGYSIQQMQDTDYVIFCDGWEKASGCRIEHNVATAYGKKILYFHDGALTDLYTKNISEHKENSDEDR